MTSFYIVAAADTDFIKSYLVVYSMKPISGEVLISVLSLHWLFIFIHAHIN